MKGILKNKEGNWVVQYFIPPSVNQTGWINADSHFTELPLHPDDVNNMALQSNWLLGNKQVEFKIIAFGNPCKYHDRLLDCKVAPNCDCQFDYAAKLIPKQEELPNDNKLYKEIDNKDGSITLVPKNPDFGKIFPFGKQEESET